MASLEWSFSINYVPYFTMCSIPQLFYVVATSYQNQCKTTEMLKQRGMDIYWTFLLDNSVCICVSVCVSGVMWVWCVWVVWVCGVSVWCECGVCVCVVCVFMMWCVCVYTALCGSFFHCSLWRLSWKKAWKREYVSWSPPNLTSSYM